jgi:hypothetical protein
MADEKELGAGIPTVLKENIITVLLDAVRIRGGHNYGILHAEIQFITEYLSMYQYTPVYTKMGMG